MAFYPEFKNLFTEVKGGRPLAYTPEQLCSEFERYIEDLSMNPMVVEVEYKKQSKGKSGGTIAREEQQGQKRVEKFPYPPTISDFCGRWLGKDIRWWSELDNVKNAANREAYMRIKNVISTYCRRVKLAGAEVGVYNWSIVARELGLVDKQQVEHTGKTIQYMVGGAKDAEELKKAADGVGLAE